MEILFCVPHNQLYIFAAIVALAAFAQDEYDRNRVQGAQSSPTQSELCFGEIVFVPDSSSCFTSQELLKAAGLPVSGKKDDLIARLLEADAVEPVESKEALVSSETSPAAQKPEAAVVPDEPVVIEPVVEEVVEVMLSTGVQHPREAAEEAALELERPAKRARVSDVVAPTTQVISATAESAAMIVEKLVAVAPPAPLSQIAPPEPLEQEEPPEYNFEPEVVDLSSSDMYLDTVRATLTKKRGFTLTDSDFPQLQINRSALDFDFERLCSVTLSHNNIYACLVDGKYFQGRGKKSPAYAHSIAEDKHVFINLTTLKVRW